MTDATTRMLATLGQTADAQGFSQLPETTLATDALSSGFISVLSHYRLLVIEGPDTAKFLQGQTSCDFNEVDGTRARYGTLCNPKGRMLASFRAGRLADARYALRLRSDIEASTREVLAKYIVFSKAKQTELGNDWVVLGVGGTAAVEALRAQVGTVPESEDQALALDGGWLLGCGPQRYEVWLQADAAAALWRALSPALAVQSSALWELAGIQAGLGEVSAATRELFIPQELNLQLTGAVNFKKGCYTGQEVVARLQYRGKLKHHMYRLRFEGPAPAPATPVHRAGEPQRVGDIVSSVATGPGRGEALALLNDNAVETLPLICAPDCRLTEVLPLPYAIT